MNITDLLILAEYCGGIEVHQPHGWRVRNVSFRLLARESSMNTASRPSFQPETFTRQSDTESICTSCPLVLKADRYQPIEVAEDIHSDLCLANAPSFQEPF